MGIDNNGADRRLMRKHSQALAGLAYLAVVALFVTLCILDFEKKLPWQGSAMVLLRTTAPGLELNPHSDVKFDGLVVGEVRQITSDGRTATIRLALNSNDLRYLPANIDAAIVPKTLFGEKYVDLRLPASPDSARLVNGGAIQQSTTSVELSTLFSNLVPVLQALRPDQLSVILNSLAQALNGRGATLARSLNQLHEFLVRVSPHLDAFTHDIGQFAKTAGVYADGAPDLIGLLSSAAAISRELLVPQESAFGAFLDRIGATSTQTEKVLTQNAQSLITLSGRSRSVLALLDQYSTELPCFARALHTFDNLNTHAIGALGPFTHVQLQILTQNTPYTNPADLPWNPTADANNANLPKAIPHQGPLGQWAPHCPRFSAEVLALRAAVPYSQLLQGTAIDPPGTAAVAPTDPASSQAVAEARDALARALVATELGVPQAQVPPYADLLVAPMLADGQVAVP